MNFVLTKNNSHDYQQQQFQIQPPQQMDYTQISLGRSVSL